MTLQEYQEEAAKTAIYPKTYDIMYPLMGGAGEFGEMLNKYKKVLRDDNGVLSGDKRLALIDELGDTLWYLAAIARDLNTSLDLVAIQNIAKLKSRKERGVLKGSGDTR